MANETQTERLAYALRAIAERAHLPMVRHLALKPGVRSVMRVTVYHHHRTAHDSVATLCRSSLEAPELSIVHEGVFFPRPLTHPIPMERVEVVMGDLQRLHFDHLLDQPGLPLYGLDLWMVERAAGAFVKSVILSPQTADGPYAGIAAAIKSYLPEALREIRRAS